MVATAVSGFLAFLLIGAAFGVAGLHVRSRLGRSAIAPLWLGTAAALAMAGTLRSARLERGFPYRPAQQHPVWMFLLFGAFLLLMLGPSALMLRGEPRASAVGDRRRPSAVALRSALLVLPGLMLATAIGLALDLGRVNFLPPR